MTEDGETDSKLQYWTTLTEADQTASQDFDKAVMALAGGALGLSLTFIKDVVKHPTSDSIFWITWSWILLTMSLLGTLASLLASQRSLRKAMRQLSRGTLQDGRERPGGIWSIVTHTCNFLAALSLIVGLAFLVRFAVLNYRGGPSGDSNQQAGTRSEDSRLRQEGVDAAHLAQRADADSAK